MGTGNETLFAFVGDAYGRDHYTSYYEKGV